MAHAYTPGLKVAAKIAIEKTRKLPLLGDVLVKKDDQIDAKTIVAKTELPGKVYPINVAGQLALGKASELPEAMLKKEGDRVEKGEMVAQSKGFFGFFKSEYKAPITGTINQISGITGQVIFNAPAIPVEIDAYVDGKVLEELPKEGVIMGTEGVHIQGIIGLGGETQGEIMMACDSPDTILDENMITESMKGKVIVAGAKATLKALKKAKEIGVNGIITGCFEYQDIKEILGRDLGVAITGHEKIGFTLILTEGFGTIPMANRTFDLLKKYVGHKASINGATQIRAGVMRPEIIITHDDQLDKDGSKNYETAGIEAGDQIRIIRAPYFGKLGTVVSLPVEKHKVESGTWVRVLVANVDGKDVLIPRANIEMIEK
ncbi:MAG: hypothetical protein PF574_08120 [Candidatus Delongbacteria bacterium]|jgi:hypothetical protein|nr:hypothetical protein [Candidatus Delongbacteria bacterium]